MDEVSLAQCVVVVVARQVSNGPYCRCRRRLCRGEHDVAVAHVVLTTAGMGVQVAVVVAVQARTVS